MSLRAVVLDLEGTTSSTGFVRDTLRPYGRERFERWIVEHATEPEVQVQLAAVRDQAREPDASLDRVVWWLNHWLDRDRTITPLQAFQGWIWAEGFVAGEVVPHFFDDVIPAIRRWHGAGLTLHVFSSVSVGAQRAWFGNTPEGDLLPILRGHFYTASTGSEREADSYRAITAKIGVAPDETVYFSGQVADLDAARTAGWHTVEVRRPAERYDEGDDDRGVGDHLAIHSFDEIDLSGDVPVRR